MSSLMPVLYIKVSDGSVWGYADDGQGSNPLPDSAIFYTDFEDDDSTQYSLSGTRTLVTTEYKFGSKSLYADGGVGTCTISSTCFSGLSTTTGLTVEFWVKLSSTRDQVIFDFKNQQGLYFHYMSGYIDLGIFSGYAVQYAQNLTDDFHHIAVVKQENGSQITLFVDGVRVASGNASTTATFTDATTYPFLFSGRQSDWPCYGWFDGLLIASEELYDSDFTPPSSPYSI